MNRKGGGTRVRSRLVRTLSGVIGIIHSPLTLVLNNRKAKAGACAARWLSDSAAAGRAPDIGQGHENWYRWVEIPRIASALLASAPSYTSDYDIRRSSRGQRVRVLRCTLFTST